jgi:hypothetical protein
MTGGLYLILLAGVLVLAANREHDRRRLTFRERGHPWDC